MEKSNLRSKLKRFLASFLVGTTLLFPNVCKAKTLEKTPAPSKISFDFKDPRIDSEANTKLKNTLVNIFGESVEYVVQKIEKEDKNPYATRALELLLNTAGNSFFNTVSHEYGHFRAGEECGAVNPKIKLDFFNRSSYKYDGLKKDSLDARLKISEAGPNQDSLNALDFFRKSQINYTEFYEHLNKIQTRLSQNLYLWKIEKGASKGGLDDYKNIEELLNRKGYDVSLNRMRLNNTILNLLSFDSWKSLHSLLKFMGEGKRESKPFYLKTGELEVGLPNFSHFFTPKGEYATISEFLRYQDLLFELNLSHDLDFTQKRAGLNRMRLGGKLYGLKISDGVSVSPYFYTDLKRSNFDFRGFSTGIEAEISLPKDINLYGKIEYNDDDLDADIKGKGNGVYATAGFKFIFK